MNDFRVWLAEKIGGERLAAVRADLAADGAGWRKLGGATHDRPAHEQQAQYEDALTAWRKNPMAWRIVQITTDYTVGQGISLSSPDRHMQRFIHAFWNHPQNRIALRLESMSEELARAGDLFPVLFRQRQDGVSLLRFITKDQVSEIETKRNDWEMETAVLQGGFLGGSRNDSSGGAGNDDFMRPKRWLTPADPRSKRSRAVALHYHINRPVGATFGESDLATVLPWLLRYSRMLEDRVRFHWATRVFLWFVRVPHNRVAEKAEQYRRPPDAGSVIVHDESEEWQAKSPVIRGTEAAPDLKAVRHMIDAGSGFPPHWRGEATDVNLATAQAMQEPAERHLARRQRYFLWMLQDLTYQAYQRASELRPQMWPALAGLDYGALFTAATPDISRSDNVLLAQAADNLAGAFERLQGQYPGSPTLRRLLLKLVLRFAGEPQEDRTLDAIMQETGQSERSAEPGERSPGGYFDELSTGSRNDEAQTNGAKR